MKLLAGIIGKNLQPQSVDLIEVAAVARDEREAKRQSGCSNPQVILPDIGIKAALLSLAANMGVNRDHRCDIVNRQPAQQKLAHDLCIVAGF